MKNLSLITMAFGLAATCSASTLTVSAYQDIYRAGGFNTGDDGGTAPTQVNLAAGNGRVLTMNSVTGQWSCNNTTYTGPDGGACYTTGMGVTGVGNLSGISSPDLNTFLVGVFLTDANPPLATAPPDLRFYNTDSSTGGIQTGFASLAAQIGQVFFIGDGLTGTGAGNTQQFYVPDGATRLYLGFADTGGFCCGAPNAYGDNWGTLNVDLNVAQASATPEPGSLFLLGGAMLAIPAIRRKKT